LYDDHMFTVAFCSVNCSSKADDDNNDDKVK